MATPVYRKDSTEPCIVPFRSYHLRNIYNGLVFHIFCPQSFAFFPFSDSYPPTYIFTWFKKFFNNKLSPTFIIPLIPKPNDFLFVPSYILNRQTLIEHQLASRIPKTTDALKNDTIDDPLVWMRLKILSNSDRNLIVHYTQEARLGIYKKHIHQLWDQIFADTPVTNSKLIVGNRNSRNATKILIRRRPYIMSSTENW